MQKMKQEFGSAVRQRKASQIRTNRIEGFHALGRANVKTGGVLCKINTKMPKRLQSSRELALRLAGSLGNGSHASVGFREEDAESIRIADLVCRLLLEKT